MHRGLALLWYCVLPPAGLQDRGCPIPPLHPARPRFGGLRWWFVCPLVVGGRQLLQALHTLERLQKTRAGEDVPAPAALDVTVNGEAGRGLPAMRDT